jgi:hypothetical protein
MPPKHLTLGTTDVGVISAAQAGGAPHVGGPGRLDAVETVETPGLREVRVAVTQLFGDGGIVVVNGQPGVGKTFATRVVLGASGLPVAWVDMPDTPKGKETSARIFAAVTGRRPPYRMTEYALTEETVDVLDGLRAVLVIDEAQNMTRSALRQVRYLHDRPSTRALLILIGSGVTTAVAHVPELHSRIARTVNIGELTGAQLRVLLPRFHSLYGNTPSDVLAELAAKGNLRRWARILEAALHLGADPSSGIDTKTAQHVLRAINGSTIR